jgi:hypothetical protein
MSALCHKRAFCAAVEKVASEPDALLVVPCYPGKVQGLEELRSLLPRADRTCAHVGLLLSRSCVLA